jgi:hypothetical protein
MLGEHPLALRVVLGQVDELEGEQAVGELQGGLDRVGQPLLRGRLHRQPVDHHFDGVFFLLLEARRLGQRVNDTVDSHAGETLRLQVVEQLAVFALAAANQRRKHLEAHTFVELEDPVDDLLRGLPGNRPPADRTVRVADAGVEQPQVVVDLGDGADG